MNNLRERWRGLTALGVAVFAAACMTVAPAPSFADIDFSLVFNILIIASLAI